LVNARCIAFRLTKFIHHFVAKALLEVELIKLLLYGEEGIFTTTVSKGVRGSTRGCNQPRTSPAALNDQEITEKMAFSTDLFLKAMIATGDKSKVDTNPTHSIEGDDITPTIIMVNHQPNTKT
jgi:hypothetical protein